MIRIVVPELPRIPPDAEVTKRGTMLFRRAAAMLRAEAWQAAAALHAFTFDPSVMPPPPHSFTTTAGGLARELYGSWAPRAEAVPRTITSEGATETTWPKRSGVSLFVVDTPTERRHIYFAANGFITTRFPRRQVQVGRFGRYTTGTLGGRNARAAAETLGEEPLELGSAVVLWPLEPECASPYSVLSRTLIAMAATVLEAGAPELRRQLEAIDVDEPMRDAIANLTVDEVHAY